MRREECVGTGMFPHMRDIKGRNRKVVERTLMNMGELGLRTARRSKVPGNLHVPQSCIGVIHNKH